MKLSVFFDHILEAKEQTGKPLEELLEGVRRSGIEAVEINLGCMERHPDYIDKLKAADLKISCIYEFYEMGLREENEKAKRHIEAAASVGAKKVLVVPGFLRGFESLHMHWRMKHPRLLSRWLGKKASIRGMVQGLTYMTKLGAECGVTVTVEDFDSVHSPLSGMHGVHWFLKQVPGLKYTLDTGNYLFYDENVLDAWELLKDKVAHVHCKDRALAGAASVQVGSGRMPIKELVEALKTQGYDGYLAIEHFEVEGQEACMAGSAEYLQGLL